MKMEIDTDEIDIEEIHIEVRKTDEQIMVQTAGIKLG